MNGMRTAAWALVVALAVALGLTAVSAAPAQACSCVKPPLTTQYAEADAVFTAELASRTVGGGHSAFGRLGMDLARYVFDVKGVLKGGVAQQQGVMSLASSAECGLEGHVGGSYLVVAEHDDDGVLTASLCSGTTPLTADLQAELGALGIVAYSPLPGNAGGREDGAWPRPRHVGVGLVLLVLLCSAAAGYRWRRS